MSSLPRVAQATRERVSRELDNLGPEVCRADVTENLRRNNPELLEMATKWATDIADPDELMLGFCVFYRLLLAQAAADDGRHWEVGARTFLDPLPRVTAETRALVARRIGEQGTEDFTRESIGELERHNAELLQLAHRFAARQKDYLGAMQGFGLLYACLVAQLAADRTYAH
jgi:hypothetical protein